jgi:hypothetical protein
MARVKVDLGGLKDFKIQLRKVVKQKAKEIDAVLEAGVGRMRRGAIRDAPADQATLRSGITYEKTGDLQYTLFSNAFHSVYMEFGTKGNYRPIPGVDPSEFKATGEGKTGKGFYDSILEWVKRKKITGTYSTNIKRNKDGTFSTKKTRGKRVGSAIDQQIEDEQAAFAIYLSIIRHGVKPHPFFFKQQEQESPRIIREIQNVLND